MKRKEITIEVMEDGTVKLSGPADKEKTFNVKGGYMDFLVSLETMLTRILAEFGIIKSGTDASN